MEPEEGKSLSLLPPVDALLADPRLNPVLDEDPRPLVRERLREALAAARREIRAGTWQPQSREEAVERILGDVLARLADSLRVRMQPVWNATGVLLHTNLGRAVLPAEARRALMGASSGYSALEIDLASGARASRLAAVRELVPLLTGAEAGFAVNNNAGALFLAMAALARGREVLVARGQLVEIGGSFRLPDILEAAGATLREVGTSNRTRISDYERALGEATAVVLRVHRSNFKLVGFTEEPSIEEMVAFSRRHGLPLVDDLGSGALRAHADLFPDEPVIEESVQAGADLVCVSGDKLLGLGQAGILAGKKAVIERLARHPIARVVRLDKTLIAVLEAGLRLHLRGPEVAREGIPLLRALGRSHESVRAAADRCARLLRGKLGERFDISVIEVRGEIGGGSLPGIDVASCAVSIVSRERSADAMASRLRAGRPPIIGRIQDDRLLLDLRAIEEEDESAFVDDVAVALEGGSA
jgi:L-seryl-tRNA(Ser) seleniumtransferase